MCAFQIFLSVDPSLGRLDYSLLSDQTLMEMLIEGFDDETKKTYQDDHGMYLDICEWPKIKCDEDESVIEITINSRRVTGSIEFCHVPPKVQLLWISPWRTEVYHSELTGSVDLTNLPGGMSRFIFEYNRLTGEINLTHLPDGMEDLCLTSNQISGTLDLTHLPDGMKSLFLASNHLTGEIDLTHLPDGMEDLCLTSNQISGTLDLTHLPEGMECLRLNNNTLTGEIDLTHLPDGMECLYLQNNQLSGPLVVQKIPPEMEMIHLEENHFNTVAVVDSKTHATINLRGSGVSSVVDEDGNERGSRPFVLLIECYADEIIQTMECRDTVEIWIAQQHTAKRNMEI